MGGVPEARLPRRSFRMPPSHNPLFLGTPASCLLLSLRLDATEGESALGRAFTSPSLSPGDAMLVLWRAAGPQLPTAINLALQCCRKVQKKYGTYDTHSGLKLHLKIGTGTDGSAVGGDRQFFFVCSGALDEVVKAQKLSAAHEVVLSQTCWELCDQQRIRAKPLACPASDGLRFLSLGLRRPTLRMCDDSELAARLEKYLSTLREDVPLELCSELRPVTSLFVQLKFADRINAIELSSSLGDCSNTISGIISPHKGEINKTLLFDKGCTFLCVFGFPGEKLAHEITHALECAMQIFHMTSMGLRKLQLVSVGVSSGAAFCGFTGHPERFEHTGRAPLS
uniref:Guanylate cyclase domain-containing protein n=1 Tax=Gallus gallus TaxID=9031 RepID=A0A8V0XRH7_CHICK